MRLEETIFYRELQSKARRHTLARTYKGQLDSSLDAIEAYLGEIRRFFHHFTDHSIHHSIRLIENVGHLMTRKQLRALSPSDLFLLIASVLTWK